MRFSRLGRGLGWLEVRLLPPHVLLLVMSVDGEGGKKADVDASWSSCLKALPLGSELTSIDVVYFPPSIQKRGSLGESLLLTRAHLFVKHHDQARGRFSCGAAGSRTLWVTMTADPPASEVKVQWFLHAPSS